MQFSFTEYIDGLRQSLSELAPRARLAFCFYCTECTWVAIGQRLSRYLPGDFDVRLKEVTDGCWRILDCETFDVDQLDPLIGILEDLTWERLAHTDDRKESDDYPVAWSAADSLNAVRSSCSSGSAEDAASSGEVWLNCVDYIVGEELGGNYTEQTVADSRFQSVIERQQAAVRFLRSMASANDLRRQMRGPPGAEGS